MSRSRIPRPLAMALTLAPAILVIVAAATTLGASRSELSAEGSESSTAVATFAGGCFWCMEPPFDELDGVLSTTSGYTGGPERNPTYKQVAYGRTGHAEAVEVAYDPSVITYAELLEVFWRNIDPTTADRQFCDRGRHYRTAIYYHDDEQRRLAEETRDRIAASGVLDGPIVTEIEAAGEFWRAEEYHQDYYLKNPGPYKRYRIGCGRDRVLERIWGAGD